MAEQNSNINKYYQQMLEQAEATQKKQRQEYMDSRSDEALIKNNFARWAKKEEFCRDLKPLIIENDEPMEKSGVSLFNSDGVAYVDTSDSHTLIIGSSGSKKSRLVILPTILNLLKAGESMVVTDPKGELYERTSKRLKDAGYKVYCVNFRDESVMNCWNPLSIPREFYLNGKFDLAVGLISDFAEITMQKDARGNKDPFWDEMSQACFMAMLLMMFALAEDPKEINIRGMLNMRNGLLADQKLVKSVYNLLDKDSLLASYYASVCLLPERTFASVLATLDTHLQKFLIRPALTDMLCQDDVNMHALGREKMAVFLVMPDEKETYHGLVSLLIQQCYEALIYDAQHYPQKTLPNRVNFLLDEFASLPKIKEFPSMISAARSRNIRFDIVIQSEKQLTATYGDHAETIKGNCNNWIYLYSREWETLTSISMLCGKQRDDSLLVTPSRLQRLKKDLGECLILHGREYPFLSKLDDISVYDGEYFEEPYREAFDHGPCPYFEFLRLREERSDAWFKEHFYQQQTVNEYIPDQNDLVGQYRYLERKIKKEDDLREMQFQEKKEQTIRESIAKWNAEYEWMLARGFHFAKRDDRKNEILEAAEKWHLEHPEVDGISPVSGPVKGMEFRVEYKEKADKVSDLVWKYDDRGAYFIMPEGEKGARHPLSLAPFLLQVNHNHMMVDITGLSGEESDSMMKYLYSATKQCKTKIPIFFDCKGYTCPWNRFLRAQETYEGKLPIRNLGIFCNLFFEDQIPVLDEITNAKIVNADYRFLGTEKGMKVMRADNSRLAAVEIPEEVLAHMELVQEEFQKGADEKDHVPEYVIFFHNLELSKHKIVMAQLALALMKYPNVQVIVSTTDQYSWKRNFGYEAMKMETWKDNDPRYISVSLNMSLFYDEDSGEVMAVQSPIPSVWIKPVPGVEE